MEMGGHIQAPVALPLGMETPLHIRWVGWVPELVWTLVSTPVSGNTTLISRPSCPCVGHCYVDWAMLWQTFLFRYESRSVNECPVRVYMRVASRSWQGLLWVEGNIFEPFGTEWRKEKSSPKFWVWIVKLVGMEFIDRTDHVHWT
jgi:hypothetical protein